MLKEAFRVLKKGGVAAFSIWGREENSPMMTIPGKVFAAYKKNDGESVRSNFHLGNKHDALREEVLSYGFSTCVIWSNIMAANYTTGEEFCDIQCQIPYNKMLLESLPEDEQQKIRNELTTKGQEVLDKGNPICLEVEIIVVTK